MSTVSNVALLMDSSRQETVLSCCGIMDRFLSPYILAAPISWWRDVSRYRIRPARIHLFCGGAVLVTYLGRCCTTAPYASVGLIRIIMRQQFVTCQFRMRLLVGHAFVPYRTSTVRALMVTDGDANFQIEF